MARDDLYPGVAPLAVTITIWLLVTVGPWFQVVSGGGVCRCGNSPSSKKFSSHCIRSAGSGKKRLGPFDANCDERNERNSIAVCFHSPQHTSFQCRGIATAFL